MSLINNLNEIKRQKNEYIIPENIRKNVEVFGVTGTLEEGGGDYNSVIEPTIKTTYSSVLFNMVKINYLILKLPSILEIDSNVINISGLFSNCVSLTEIPFFDTSNVTNMQNMFENCYSITTIPLFNTSNVTNMQSMFQACTNLITIPLLDTSSCLNMQNMFQGCTKLSDDSLNNIMKMCINTPSNYARTKSLSNIGLNGPQRTTCQTLSNYQDFLDAGWSDS